MHPRDIRTIEDLCDYIEEYADKIPIRETLDGKKWDSYYLTNLPPQLAIKHTLRFIREGRIPLVVERSITSNEEH